MKRTIIITAGAILLALGAALATTGALAQSIDEDGCWAAHDCVTGTSEWERDNFISRYRNVCDDRVYMKFCNQASALQSGEDCGASGLRPGGTKVWKTYNDPTGQYAWAWVGSTKPGKDWVCSDKWGLNKWEPDW